MNRWNKNLNRSDAGVYLLSRSFGTLSELIEITLENDSTIPLFVARLGIKNYMDRDNNISPLEQGLLKNHC